MKNQLKDRKMMKIRFNNNNLPQKIKNNKII